MTPQRLAWPLAIAALLAVLAVLPSFAAPYTVSLMLSVLAYVIMATAWSIFSGSTRYVSLASAAFFGIGAYAFAYYGEVLPLPIIALIGAAAGFVVAVVVGLATLRLSGIYFVVFTFGLSELIRQLMIWYEINQTRTMVRHIYVDVWAEDLYYHLLVLCVITFGIGYLIQRSKLGLALRAIGEDEAVANHTGVNTTFTKVLVFGISSGLIAATGALLTPRWTYVDPNIAFNPLLSFLVLIMALLGGGGRLYGPALGAVPMVLLFEVLSATFPHQFNIVLGACFVIIVFFLPAGVVGGIESLVARLRAWRAAGGPS